VVVEELRALFTPASSMLQLVDDLAVLGSRAPHGGAIIVAVTSVETRVGLVAAGITKSHIALRDSGLIDADSLVVTATGRALMKEHGIDIDDDASLRAALITQVELGRRAGDANFDVSIAGATVEVSSALVDQAVYPVAARIALAVEELQAADPTASVALAADDPAWPSLVSQVSRLIGRDVEQIAASTWVRMG
jgi:hypothetical protein